MWDVKVGDVVYVAYTPVRVGRVVAVMKRSFVGRIDVVRVRWLRPHQAPLVLVFDSFDPAAELDARRRVVAENVVTTALKGYATLVEDHERKARHHRAVLEAAMKIVV